MTPLRTILSGGLAALLAMLAGSSPVRADSCRASTSNTAAAEQVRVVVRSAEQMAISAELNARITHLPPREGDRFKRGDLLVTFDCSRMSAEREASIATFKAARAAHHSQLALARYKAASLLTIEQSRFEMEKSEADVRVVEARLSACAIHAPFSGRVVEKIAHVNEIAQPNQPLLRLINEERLDLILMVPSSTAGRIADGSTFRVCIDETREQHAARVVQSTGLIDPVSQSVRVIGEFAVKPDRVLPGMSGTGFLNLLETRP